MLKNNFKTLKKKVNCDTDFKEIAFESTYFSIRLFVKIKITPHLKILKILQ